MKDDSTIALVACLVIAFLLYNYVNLSSPNRVPFSPDENGLLWTARELSENGSVFWTSLLNQRYNVTFFRPRLFTEVAPNVYVTSNSMGFAVFLALANELHILPFFVPLTALLGVLGAYGAVAEVSGKKAGVLVAATLATLPPYVFFSNTYMDIVPSLSFFLLSLFGFLKYMKSSKTWQVVISSLCLAIAIYLRTYSALSGGICCNSAIGA